MAAAFGAPRPRHVPRWLLGLLPPNIGMVMVDKWLPVSNAKAKTEPGCQPRFRHYREGIAAMVSGSDEDAEVLRLLSRGGLDDNDRRIAG